MWQHFAELTNFGKIREIDASMDFVKNDNCFYDRVSLINLISDKNLIGRVVQDGYKTCKNGREFN